MRGVVALDVREGAVRAILGRAHALASHWIGRLVLPGLIALPLWKGAHHLRPPSVDFGGAARDTAVATLFYGLAALDSLLAVCAVVRL